MLLFAHHQVRSFLGVCVYVTYIRIYTYPPAIQIGTPWNVLRAAKSGEIHSSSSFLKRQQQLCLAFF